MESDVSDILRWYITVLPFQSLKNLALIRSTLKEIGRERQNDSKTAWIIQGGWTGSIGECINSTS